MPISLNGWRIRVGRFVQQRRNFDFELIVKSFLEQKKRRKQLLQSKNETEEDLAERYEPDESTFGKDAYASNNNSRSSETNCSTGSGAEEHLCISQVLVSEAACSSTSPPSTTTVTKDSETQNDRPPMEESLLETADICNHGEYEDTATRLAGNQIVEGTQRHGPCSSKSHASMTTPGSISEMLLVKAGDVELNPGPSQLGPGSLTSIELYELTDHMDPNDFRKVGLALGFKEAALSRYERDAGNSHNATYRMFTDWFKTVLEADARKYLVDTFMKAKLIQLAERLRKGLLVEHLPPITEEQLENCAEDMKDFFTSGLCKIQTDPVNNDSILEFDHIYTNLAVLEEDVNTKLKKPIAFSELLKTKVNGVYPNRLMIEGEGGAGKTTLCAKIAWDWTTGKGFQQFKLVLVVPLRKAKSKTVGEIVKEYLSDRNDVKPRQLDEYIRDNPDKVLLVFDGMDELDSDFGSSDDVVQIIRGSRYQSNKVIVTTRPWKADQIRRNRDLRKLYAFMAITGFDKTNLSSYITKFFAEERTTGEDLIQFIEDNDVIAENMAPFPIYIAMLCTMWREFDGERREAMRKLQTFSQLFKEMLTFLIDHYISKDVSNDDDESLSLRRKRVEEMLLKIGQIAFQGLLVKRLLFSEAEFSECWDALETGCKVGVLTREKKIVPRRNRQHHASNSISTVLFPHKLFQEYMAGLYLAFLYHSQREEYTRFMTDVISRKKAGEFRYLLYFTSSRAKDIGLDIISRVTGTQNFEIDFVIDLVFECQDEEAARVVRERVRPQDHQVVFHKSAHTALGYMFVLEHCELEHLTVVWTGGRTLTRHIVEFMCSAPLLLKVTLGSNGLYMVHPEPNLSDEFLSLLACRAGELKIITLRLQAGNFSSAASRNIATILSSSPTLTNLSTGNIRLHGDFYSTVVECAGSIALKAVEFFGPLYQENASSSSELATWICTLPLLTDLTLWCQELNDAFYSTLASKARTGKIQTLTLGRMDIGRNASASEDCARFVCSLPSLTNLTMKRAELHDYFYSKMAFLATSTVIQTLTIRAIEGGKDSSRSRDLAMCICAMQCLSELTLQDCALANEFYLTLSALADSTKVKNLTLREMRISEQNLLSCISLGHLQHMLVNLVTVVGSQQSTKDDEGRVRGSPLSDLTIDSDIGDTLSTLGDTTPKLARLFPHLQTLNLRVFGQLSTTSLLQWQLTSLRALHLQPVCTRFEKVHNPVSFGDGALVGRVLLKCLPQLVNLIVTNLMIGNTQAERFLHVLNEHKHLTSIRLDTCFTDKELDSLILKINNQGRMEVTVQHGPCTMIETDDSDSQSDDEKPHVITEDVSFQRFKNDDDAADKNGFDNDIDDPSLVSEDVIDQSHENDDAENEGVQNSQVDDPTSTDTDTTSSCRVCKCSIV